MFERGKAAEFVPEDRSGRVRDAPRPFFRMFHNPADWQLDDEGNLRPGVSHVSMTPGAGVEADGDDRPLRERLRKDGWVELPRFLPNPDGPPVDLLAVYLNHRGHSVHRTVFLVPEHAPGGGKIPTRWVIDREAVRDYTTWLVEAGHIAPPQPSVLAELIRRAERKLDRLLVATELPASSPETAARRKVKLERTRLALASLRQMLPVAEQRHGTTVRSSARDALARLRAGPPPVARQKGKA